MHKRSATNQRRPTTLHEPRKATPRPGHDTVICWNSSYYNRQGRKVQGPRNPSRAQALSILGMVQVSRIRCTSPAVGALCIFTRIQATGNIMMNSAPQDPARHANSGMQACIEHKKPPPWNYINEPLAIQVHHGAVQRTLTPGSCCTLRRIDLHALYHARNPLQAL